VYGNKDENSVIFKKELEELCQKYDRLKVTYVYSRQKNSDALFEGRIDKIKCGQLLDRLQMKNATEYFICGPEQMIIDVSETLKELGIDKKKVHFELFTTPVKLPSESKAAGSFNGTSEVTVIMDGMETSFQLDANGLNILDASIDAGVDAPFSCKGAVCCTCKAKIVEGKAMMDMNYALSDEEVEKGYILTCQSHPQSEKLIVDFDV
jgi:ring-1,2-phenylacetyl-CoA epoxidase subunit PaaE